MLHARDSVDSLRIHEGVFGDSYALAPRFGTWEETTVAVSFCYEGTIFKLKYEVSEPELRRECTYHNEMVCMDSCVEAFLMKPGDLEYNNFEFSAAGYSLVARRFDRERKTFFSPAQIETIERTFLLHELRPGKAVYTMTMHIDLSGFALASGPLKGQQLLGNFYKCGFALSSPPRFSLFPLGNLPDFHQKDKFRPLLFV
jgi:hypothetical protein